MQSLGDPRLFLFHCQPCLVGVLMDQLHVLLLASTTSTRLDPLSAAELGGPCMPRRVERYNTGQNAHQGAAW